jgi:cysteine synthase A
MSTGTGGTLAGVSMYLKEKNSKIRTVLADPPVWKIDFDFFFVY